MLSMAKTPVHGENSIQRVDEQTDKGQLDFGVLNCSLLAVQVAEVAWRKSSIRATMQRHTV